MLHTNIVSESRAQSRIGTLKAFILSKKSRIIWQSQGAWKRQSSGFHERSGGNNHNLFHQALYARVTGTEVIEQPQTRQPPAEEPSIVFGLTKEPDPLYQSATPDLNASVLDGFMLSKHTQNGRVLLGSDEHHECPAKPGRPSSLTDYSVSRRRFDFPAPSVSRHRFGRSTRTFRTLQDTAFTLSYCTNAFRLDQRVGWRWSGCVSLCPFG